MQAPVPVAVPAELVAAGAAHLVDWQAGHVDPVFLHDVAGVALQVVMMADHLVEMAKAPPVAEGAPWSPTITDIGTRLDAAEALAAAGKPEIAIAYRAALEVAVSLYRGGVELAPPGAKPTVLVVGPTPPAPLADVQLGQLAPSARVTLYLAGIVATVATAWMAKDAVVEVLKDRAALAAQVDQYIRDLQVRAAAGQPLPPPPKPVEHAAASNKGGGLVLYGAIAAGVAAAGYGAYCALKTPAMRSNPARRVARARVRRALRRRANPSPPPRRRRRKALRGGYSRDAVSANIGTLVRAGKPGPEAAGIALANARAEYRKAHPVGAFPKHLETPAERSALKRRRRRAKPKPAPRPRPPAPRRRPKVAKRARPARRAPKRAKRRAGKRR